MDDSSYTHLDSFPAIKQFCTENNINIGQCKYSNNPRNYLTNILATGTPQEKAIEQYRKDLNKCLTFACKHRILNDKRTGDIKSGPRTSFVSTLNELKVGIWLENQGFQFKCFDPPTIGRGKGEFIVEKTRNKLFIEVKTFFKERVEFDRIRFFRDLSNCLKENNLPIHDIKVLRFPENFDFKNQKATLLENIIQKLKSNISKNNGKFIDYKENNDILLRFTQKLTMPGKITGTDVFYPNTQKYLEGRFDQGQLSSSDIPSLFILCDKDGIVESDDLQPFLYGSFGEDCTTYPPKKYRDNNGFWKNNKSKLTAVIILRGENELLSINAYLCPNPEYTFDKQIFIDKSIKWWSLDKDKVRLVSC